MRKIKTSSKFSVRVPKPKGKAGSSSRLLKGTPSKLASNKRIYTKSTLDRDPTVYSGLSFGNTGLDGEN